MGGKKAIKGKSKAGRQQLGSCCSPAGERGWWITMQLLKRMKKVYTQKKMLNMYQVFK